MKGEEREKYKENHELRRVSKFWGKSGGRSGRKSLSIVRSANFVNFQNNNFENKIFFCLLQQKVDDQFIFMYLLAFSLSLSLSQRTD